MSDRVPCVSALGCPPFWMCTPPMPPLERRTILPMGGALRGGAPCLLPQRQGAGAPGRPHHERPPWRHCLASRRGSATWCTTPVHGWATAFSPSSWSCACPGTRTAPPRPCSPSPARAPPRSTAGRPDSATAVRQRCHTASRLDRRSYSHRWRAFFL